MSKVLIISLDGGTFSIIDPLINEGKLPVLSSLIKEGVRATLKSTIPPASCPAWDSFITGKNPGKLGVFDIFYRSSDSYKMKRPNSLDRKGESFWNYINGKSILVNIPMTFPPEKTNGIMVSGRWATEDSEYTHPTEIKQEIDKVADGYILAPGDKLDINKHYETIDKREKVVLHLMDKEWDLFVVNFLATDVVCHGFWDTEEIEKTYTRMDTIVGKMLEKAGDAHIMIISDHGMTSPGVTFWPNTWLQKEGFLKLQPITKKKKIQTIATGQKVKVRKVLEKARLLNLAFKVTPKSINKLIPSTGPTIYTADVDWENTKAYSIYGNMPRIFINMKGREPNGSVDPKDYETVRNDIIEKLKTIKHPDINTMKVYKREDLYAGKHVGQAPDILVQFNNFDSAYMQPQLDNKEILSPMKKNFAWHHPDGILIMCGKGIKKGSSVPDMNLVDIAPITLHILGNPIPNDFDGEVRKDIFEEESEHTKREVTLREPREKEERGEHKLTAEQEDKVLKQLQSMGYS